MDKPIVTAVCFTDADQRYLAEAVGPYAQPVFSLDLRPPLGLKELLTSRSGVFAAASPLAGLVKGRTWPSSIEEAAVALSQPVASARDWLLRNLVAMTATGTAVYLVDEAILTNPDLLVILTAARTIGCLTVGILPPETRTSLSSAALALTDLVCGAEEPRALALAFRTLEGTPQSG
jgi:hypothetical protein